MRVIEGDEKPSPLQGEFDHLLATGVQPFLRRCGFSRSGLTFRRDRGEVYDLIEFQENWRNGVTRSHGSFINVGVGSIDVDAAWDGPRPLPLFEHRWESVIPDLPDEIRFDASTDMTAFTAVLCECLAEVVTAIERFDDTSTLIEYAVAHNLLIQYEHTCCYLAVISDLDKLTGYVRRLRDTFGHQERWAIFNRKISRVTAPHTQRLVALGLLDPVDLLTIGG